MPFNNSHNPGYSRRGGKGRRKAFAKTQYAKSAIPKEANIARETLKHMCLHTPGIEIDLSDFDEFDTYYPAPSQHDLQSLVRLADSETQAFV